MLNKKFKTLGLRLLCLLAAIMALPSPANATYIPDGTIIYLKPTNGWNSDGVRFAAYFFDSNDTSKNYWYSMTDNNGDGIYEADPSYGPNDYDSFIFCRMNPGNDENIWGNCYNQTVDIAYDGTNNYFEPSAPSDNKSTVTSSQYSDSDTGDNTETPELSYNQGEYVVFFDNSSSNWNTVYAHVWVEGGNNYSGGSWPGQELTHIAGNIWKWQYTGSETFPEKNVEIVFNNNNNGSQTSDLAFVNGGYYTYSGLQKTIEPTVVVTLSDVALSLDGATEGENYTWTYTHTGETASVDFYFTLTYSNNTTETITKSHDFVKDGVYTITFDEASKTGSVAVVSEPTATWSKVEILGGIYNNNFEKGNGYELSVAEDGTYVYEFTYEDNHNNPWFLYYVTLSDGTGYYLSPAADTDKYITTSAVNYCDATTSAESFNYEFEKGEKYTITLTPSASDKTSGTIAVVKVASETPTSGVLIVGDEQPGWNISDGEAMTFDSTTGLYSYTIKKNSEKEWFSFFIDGVQYASTTGDMTVALDTEYTLTQDKDSKNGRYNFTTEEGYIYTIYVNLTKNNFYVNRVKDPNAIVGIPVYPIGVSSEAELKAYDFEANPVYYLCSPVLNDNRISPEWQMTKGSDGKYHINGFAMRPTTAALDNYDSEEATAYVASYSAWDQSEATKYSEAVIKTNEHKEAGTSTPHYEGRLYNATYNPSTEELTFELVEDEMPFISMVGYNFRQKENYETPRDSETNRGWQEAWILYDANGKIVKDRAGKVLYNTMWPPKNQIFFNAVRGSENIELTSKNLTFTTNYEEKTGEEWKKQLKATSSQYNTLNLEDGKEYRRYVIENMWILGATKIWTGWGGQTVYDGNGNANSQWSNHINWGYLDVDTNDGGSTITANTTVDVVVDDKNFLFAKPTYFRTVEFFYCVDDKTNGSKFFTTLSHGDASIQAKATTDYEGSYKLAANNVPEGATITAYKVTRYEAATSTAIGVVADVKEQSLTQDGFNAIGWTDDTVLSNGKYYYVAEITFTDANGDVSTETVVSNPFTIYNATYENEVEAHQLLELTADGKEALNNTPATYITYNSAGFGALYLVNEDGSVATELTGDALTAAWSVLADDANYDWSTNVWLHSDVPADYAEAAENNAETGISLDNITNYNLFINGVESDNAPQTTDKSFSYVYDAEKIGQTNLYGLTMDYTQEISDENVSKVSAGGNANLTLVAPQAERATENEVTFGVEKVSAETTTEVKNVEGEATITDYYILKATFNFVAPNIDSDIDDAYDVVYVPTVKITNADGTVTTKVLDPTAETSVTVSDLDPTATNIEFTVETRYYPQGTTDYENTSYAVGTYGDGVTIKSEMPTLGSEAAPSVDATVGISANADDNSKYDITVSNATATLLEANSFAGEALENVYYDFDVNNEDGDQVAGLQDGQVDENGVGDNLGTVMTGVDKPESVTVAATPVYVFKVGDEFVGLRGTTGTDLVEEGSYTGVESTFADSVSVATGNGYIEVLGASEVNVYDIAGALIGGGDTRFEVVSGVYVVVADGKAMKVIVR